MTLLLDTSTFLWYIGADRRLPPATRDLLRDPEHDVVLSVVSVWEIVVKAELDRLHLAGPAWAYTKLQRDRHGFASLSLEEGALAHLGKLPPVHRDPFDRMLVCQAIEHDLTIVTNDDVLERYPVKTVWD